MNFIANDWCSVRELGKASMQSTKYFILFFIFSATPSLFCGQLLDALCGRLIFLFHLFYVRTLYSTIIYPVFLLLEISLVTCYTVLYTVRVCVYVCGAQHRHILTSTVLYTLWWLEILCHVPFWFGRNLTWKFILFRSQKVTYIL
jgi:hypothetical protein